MFNNLEPPVQDLAEKAFRLFLKNPDHPSLERHPLHDSKRGRHKIGSYSVSVSRRYRAIYVPDEAGSEGRAPANVWYWIGAHKSYNNFIGLPE